MVQKASSVDKVKIFSFKVKVVELEGKLNDLELEQALHDSFKLELKRANKDLNSKKHEIECMEKGIEAIYEIISQEIDTLSSVRLNLTEENSHL